jgi:hypothetical protein
MNNSPHILLAGSPNYLFLAELLLRSLVKFGKSDFFADLIILNANEFTCIDDLKHIKKYCKVSYSKEKYEDHYPSRWFIEPKSDVCIFLDFDILICSGVKPIVDICLKRDAFCAVPAVNHIPLNEWYRLFNLCNVKFPDKMIKTKDGNVSPYYVNYGVLAMPSKFVKPIRQVILNNVEIVKRFTSQPYFIGQISLAISLAQANIPTFVLPERFNYIDFIASKEEFDNVVFYHMLELKSIKYINDTKKLACNGKIKELLFSIQQIKML